MAEHRHPRAERGGRHRRGADRPAHHRRSRRGDRRRRRQHRRHGRPGRPARRPRAGRAAGPRQPAARRRGRRRRRRRLVPPRRHAPTAGRRRPHGRRPARPPHGRRQLRHPLRRRLRRRPVPHPAVPIPELDRPAVRRQRVLRPPGRLRRRRRVRAVPHLRGPGPDAAAPAPRPVRPRAGHGRHVFPAVPGPAVRRRLRPLGVPAGAVLARRFARAAGPVLPSRAGPRPGLVPAGGGRDQMDERDTDKRDDGHARVAFGRGRRHGVGVARRAGAAVPAQASGPRGQVDAGRPQPDRGRRGTGRHAGVRAAGDERAHPPGPPPPGRPAAVARPARVARHGRRLPAARPDAVLLASPDPPRAGAVAVPPRPPRRPGHGRHHRRPLPRRRAADLGPVPVGPGRPVRHQPPGAVGLVHAAAGRGHVPPQQRRPARAGRPVGVEAGDDAPPARHPPLGRGGRAEQQLVQRAHGLGPPPRHLPPHGRLARHRHRHRRGRAPPAGAGRPAAAGGDAVRHPPAAGTGE